jgi:hypothetical protein
MNNAHYTYFTYYNVCQSIIYKGFHRSRIYVCLNSNLLPTTQEVFVVR